MMEAEAGRLVSQEMPPIADIIEGCPDLSHNLSRSFLMEGDFLELTSKLSVKTYIKLYLFSDSIVVARKKMWRMRQSSAYKFDCMSDLTKLIAGAVSIQGAPALQLSFTEADEPLRVFSPAKNTDVRKWVAAINISTGHQQLSDELRTHPHAHPSGSASSHHHRNRRASVFVTMEDFLGEGDRIDTQEQQLRYFERQVAIQVADILKAPSNDALKERAFELRTLVDSFLSAASGWFAKSRPPSVDQPVSGNSLTAPMAMPHHAQASLVPQSPSDILFSASPSSGSMPLHAPTSFGTASDRSVEGRFARRCKALSDAVDALLEAVAPEAVAPDERKVRSLSISSNSVPLSPGFGPSGLNSPRGEDGGSGRGATLSEGKEGKCKEASKALVVATQLVGDYLQEALRIKRVDLKEEELAESPSSASSQHASPERGRARSSPAPAHFAPAPSMMGRRRSLSTSNIADLHAAQKLFQPKKLQDASLTSLTDDTLASIAGSEESLVSAHLPTVMPEDRLAIQSLPQSASLAAAAAKAARDRQATRALAPADRSDSDLDLEKALELGPDMLVSEDDTASNDDTPATPKRLERSVSHDGPHPTIGGASSQTSAAHPAAAALAVNSKHRRTASSFATLKGGLNWMKRETSKKQQPLTRTASLTNLQLIHRKMNRKSSDGSSALESRRSLRRQGESIDLDDDGFDAASEAGDPHADEDGVEADLLSIEAEDIARQLALMDTALLREITALECLDCAWTKKNKAERAPNIIACIEWFNRIALFLTTEILTCETMGVRAQVMAHCIQIARHCRKFNNFNALKAILTGLQCTPIFRLKKTWALIPAKARRHFEELSELMSEDSNHRNYREELRKAHEQGSPCVPYLGIFLTDFLFTESAFAEATAADKRQSKMMGILEQLQDLQRTAVYPFNASMRIQAFLRSARHNTEQENYRVSLEREPKETQAAVDEGGDDAFFEALGTATHEQLLAELKKLEERLDRLYAEIAKSSNKDDEEADRMWDMQRKVTQLRNLLKIKKRGTVLSDGCEPGGRLALMRQASVDDAGDSAAPTHAHADMHTHAHAHTTVHTAAHASTHSILSSSQNHSADSDHLAASATECEYDPALATTV